MSNTALVVVDGPNTAIRGFAANDKLTNPLGQPIGAVYGMARMLKSASASVRAVPGFEQAKVKFLVAWDSRPCWRISLLPTYKESRSVKSEGQYNFFEEYKKQLPLICDGLLPILGVRQVFIDNFEADDIAAWVCSGAKMPVFLMTKDEDWFQLVRPGVSILHPHGIVNIDNFEATTGCTDTEMFIKMKAIAGDGGDDVPGVRGVGKATAIKYLRGDLPTKSKRLPDIQAWLANPDGYERSRKLVDLSMIPPVKSEAVKYRGAKFDIVALHEFCVQQHFLSVIEDIDEYNTIFGDA